MPVFAQGNNGDGAVCGTGLLYTQPMCCQTDVLGVADLDCKPRKFHYNVPCCQGTVANVPHIARESPSSRESFKLLCSSEGRSARCCSVPQVSLDLVDETLLLLLTCAPQDGVALLWQDV